MINRYINYEQAIEALNTIKKQFDPTEDSYAVEALSLHIEQQHRSEITCTPPINYYTKNIDNALAMVKLITKDGYEALVYDEEGAYVVKGNYTNFDDHPRYQLPDWE